MREILPVASRWARDGRPFAMATVVGVAGSGPREVGASMVVSADGEVFGTVSGGCVEGAVYERCLEVLAGAPALVDRFSYSDADAFAVGLTCGGTIDVLVRAVPPGSATAADVQLLAAREEAAIPTRYTLVTAGDDLGRGSVADGEAGESVRGDAVQPVKDAVTVHVGVPGQLIIVGAVEFAVALARLGTAMGMKVAVVDPRPVFATAARFPTAEVIVDWPDRYLKTQPLGARTAVCVLTHDPKFDVPALRAALAAPVGYVGAMGSRRTHDDRLRRLAAAGVPETAVARLRSPIGLDLGGRTPEETALSILAEIVADRHGASGGRLSGVPGAVHADAAERAAAARACRGLCTPMRPSGPPPRAPGHPTLPRWPRSRPHPQRPPHLDTRPPRPSPPTSQRRRM